MLADSVKYGSIYLPARHLRYCGTDFYNDDHFFNSAIYEARRLITRMGVTNNSKVLDVGCGVGRLAIGLLHELPSIKQYYGIDVSQKSINWCNKYLQTASLNFMFIKVDMHNELYNINGLDMKDGIVLPFSNGEIDVVYLYSVFSHMRSGDIMNYLREFKRIIASTGKIFFTAFVEENVEDELENPENYIMTWKMPLHCVRYDRRYFDELIKQAGYKIDVFEYSVETDGQSGFFISLK